tara:strand:- start:170 stop:526 length:357 start_codon:yes stop_codon:yes gene_type:complete
MTPTVIAIIVCVLTFISCVAGLIGLVSAGLATYVTLKINPLEREVTRLSAQQEAMHGQVFKKLDGIAETVGASKLETTNMVNSVQNLLTTRYIDKDDLTALVKVEVKSEVAQQLHGKD